MEVKVQFNESNQDFEAHLGEIYKVDDKGYERGYAEGVEQVNRTLHGIYLLKEQIDIKAIYDKYGDFVEYLKDKSVYGTFFDGVYCPVEKITLAYSENPDDAEEWYYTLNFYSPYEEGGTGYRTFYQVYHYPWEDVIYEEWISEIGDWYEGELSGWNGNTATLNNKLLTFTEPMVASQRLYDLIESVTDNSSIDTAVNDARLAAERQAKVQFWNGYAGRSDFDHAFAYPGWNNTTFQPTRNINASNVDNMFGEKGVVSSISATITNLDSALAVYDVYIIISDTSLSETFSGCSSLVYIDRLKFNKTITSMSYTFEACSKLKEIRMPIPVGNNTSFSNPFYGCKELVEVRFEGEIYNNGLGFKDSTKLSKASWQNIISCLSTTAPSGRYIGGSLASVNAAFETSKGANDGSESEEWLNLIATRPNWSINLF